MRPVAPLRGVYTALVTPFEDDEVDEHGFIDNLRRQLQAGVDGVIVLGSTGEAPTLTREEQQLLVELTLQETKGEIHVMVGVGTNSTHGTIERAIWAEELGADSLLVVTPYYSRPSQRGLIEHFTAIAEQVETPLILYDVPRRTGIPLEIETTLELSKHPRIVGIKEASGSISNFEQLLYEVRTPFSVLTGDDPMILPTMALGGDGVISVISNLLPKQVVALAHAMRDGRLDIAREIHYRLLPIYRALFAETNPIGIKAAMNLCGMAAGPCRLPLTSMQAGLVKKLEHALTEHDLLPALL